MTSLFSKDILEIKKIFPLVPYFIRSFKTVNSYEEIIHIIKTYFEINKDYFEIKSFGERETDYLYCEKDKKLVETTIEVKCNPIVIGSLDEVFIHYCGDYKNDENKEKLFNQYKEDFIKTIKKDDIGRDALEFHIYIREVSFIDDKGEKNTVNFITFNYMTKIKTNLFKITYNKMREIFNTNNINNIEQYKINFSGELFEEERIQCLIPFMRAI